MAEESCALRRIYSDGENSLMMEMRAFSPEGAMRFLLHGEDLRVRLRDFSYRVLPDTEDREYGQAFEVSLDSGGAGVMFNGSLHTVAMAAQFENEEREGPLSVEEQQAREGEITGFYFPNAFADPVTINTGPLQAPMDAMRLCMDDLIGTWGIDADAHKSLTRRVEPVGRQQWTRRFAQAYPSIALARGAQASLHVRLIVNEAGRVDDCLVQSGVGLEVFNDTACNRLTRFARFEPALDAQGEPIKSYWTTSIIYAMGR